MYLLALRLTKGSDIGSIRPLRLTYAAAAPMIVRGHRALANRLASERTSPLGP